MEAENPSILKYMMDYFFSTGWFKRIYKINSSVGSDTKLKEHVNLINMPFPSDVVNYYSPDF